MQALLLVDLQNDFLPGGALAVAGGDEVIPIANRLIELFPLVVGTRDWHPPNHGGFAASHAGRRIGEVVDLDGLPQVLWPTHCVAGSAGADLAPGLRAAGVARVFCKGMDPRVDSYSGFFDNGGRASTGLAEFLRGAGVDELFVLGLATDYCVKFTALDALRLGFAVTLVVDGCRGVESRPGDTARALGEAQAAGARLATSDEVAAARTAAAK